MPVDSILDPILAIGGVLAAPLVLRQRADLRKRVDETVPTVYVVVERWKASDSVSLSPSFPQSFRRVYRQSSGLFNS